MNKKNEWVIEPINKSMIKYKNEWLGRWMHYFMIELRVV